jgi:DNA polymerase
VRLTADFETRSALKIKDVGGWVYSVHPTTDAVCLSFAPEGDSEPMLWVPDWVYRIVAPWYEAERGVPIELDCPWLLTGAVPDLIAEGIASGALFEAHNAFFERAVWRNVMRARYGWAEPPESSWRCSAAKASTYALPRSLEEVVKVLRLPVLKDKDGHSVMQKVARPRKARKAEKKSLLSSGMTPAPDGLGWVDPGTGATMYLWNEAPADLLRVWDYCRQDVRAERGLSASLADPGPRELRVWQVDQRINLRGFMIDRAMVEAAIRVAGKAVDRATADALRASRDADGSAPFTSLGQRDKLMAWLESQDVTLPDMQGPTIDAALAGELPDRVRTVLAAKRTASRTSVKKYEAMLRSADLDDLIRDALMYHGAGTGRWAGKLVQPHNFVRGKMKDPETMCAVISEGDLPWLEACYGHADPMEVLSWAVRGAIIASPGRDLLAADYSAVEARGTIWLVRDAVGLLLFSRPKGQPGIYREMASAIYNVPAGSIDKDSPDGFLKRWVGKQAILGLGYGMGAKKFVATCAKYGQVISLDFAKHVVGVYREKFASVVKFWKAVEASALRAVRDRGTVVRCGRVSFLMKGHFLYCFLPSGRPIAYFSPKIVPSPTPWGETRDKLTYMTVDGETHKWVRTDTWGGKETENIVQALCRDLMADAILRVEDGDPELPYDILLSVHDELVAEADEGRGSVEEFCSLICALEPWAEGFPLAAEGWRGKRYHK